MNKYRKKPVVIEAFQMTPDRRIDNSEWPAWLGEAWNGERDAEGTLQRVDMNAALPDMLEIVTLEGKHLVTWGDYIIRGVKGELYPCKPDIFSATYEPAALSAAPTFTAADLKRAWEMGRDACIGILECELELARAADRTTALVLAITCRAMNGETPPADLAQRVKE